MKTKDIAKYYRIEQESFEAFLQKTPEIKKEYGMMGAISIEDNMVDSVVAQFKQKEIEKRQRINEERKRRSEEEAKTQAERERQETIMASMPVTTGDLHQAYDIIGPVYFQVSNKGLFSSALDKLTKKYAAEIDAMKQSGTMSQGRADWGFLYGEWSVGQNQFESAFYVATQELKKRAALVGGDAIIGMRQDIDLDSNGFSFFYLQMYGTAVKIKEKQE